MNQNKSITPMMKQYYEIKNKFQSEIMFFRLGDFYEMFDKDAEIASKVLNITLTNRNGIKMCGVPHHTKFIYIQRLLNQGYKVAICEQLEEKVEHAIVKRGVTEVITPGTILEDTMIGREKQNQYIFSFYYEYLDPIYNIGIAYIDISTGDFFVSDFRSQKDLSSILDDMARISFCEIVLPEKIKGNKKFLNILNEYYPNVVKTYIKEDFFHLKENKKFLLEFFDIKNLESFGFNINSELSILSASALIKYIKDIQPKKLEHIEKIYYVNKSDFLYMNIKTIKHLELIENQEGKEEHTLFRILNEEVKTILGSRLLYRWILYPILDKKILLERYSIVEFLSKNLEMVMNIQMKLKSISDLERINSRIAMKKATFRDLIQLKSSLILVNEIQEYFLTISDMDLLKFFLNEKDKILINQIIYKLSESIDENSDREYFIKEEYSKELKNLRQLYRNSENVLESIQERERKRTGITNLKIRYNQIIYYFIEVTISKSKDINLPEYYIKKQSLKNVIRYTIPDLIEYEAKILNAKNKINLLEEKIFNEILTYFQDNFQIIKKVSNKIAWIDVLSNFAIQSVRYNYTRPEIYEEGDLKIIEGRHPLVERLIGSIKYISNDLYMNKKESFIHILTGPNMSGKSTFLRQNCLIIIMAQIGCFVPATFAKIPLMDQIFTRLGARDFIAKGESTFLVEMIETAYILNSLSPKSFIIMDEVGRGTSTFDGMAIAYSILLFFSNHFKMYNYVLFSTHYQELTKITYKGVVNYQCQVLEKKRSIQFLYKICKGIAKKSYGIYVAKIAGIPEEIISNANRFLEDKENNSFQMDLFQDKRFDLNKQKQNYYDELETDFHKILFSIKSTVKNFDEILKKYKKNKMDNDTIDRDNKKKG